MRPAGGFVVTCGSERERRHVDAGPALSCAITLACRADRGASAYVRDAAGEVVGRVEHGADGVVSVYGKGAK